MKFIIQRVKEASLVIDNKEYSRIDEGFLVLIGICDTDTKEIADKVNDLLKEKGISLYMQDSGSISFSQTRWDESVWNRAKAALRVNFSREKILYITQLVKQHIPIPLFGQLDRYSTFPVQSVDQKYHPVPSSVLPWFPWN